jgi:septal ring factor EnvC (AmiA/AmiB activator)
VVGVTDSNDEKITFRVDADTKRRLDGGHLNKSAVMRDLADKYARTGDTEEAALLVEREQKEDRLRELQREKSDLESDIDRVEREIDRLDRRIEQRRENTSDEAKEIADRIESGTFRKSQLTEDNPAVINWAQKAGLDPDTFIFEVREELE